MAASQPKKVPLVVYIIAGFLVCLIFSTFFRQDQGYHYFIVGFILMAVFAAFIMVMLQLFLKKRK
jgi:riboflavin transporter FmnP